MTELQLIEAIKTHIDNYSILTLWRIGITHDPQGRFLEHDADADTWRFWEARSLATAQTVENYFLRNGFEGGTGGNLRDDSVFVYVFGI